MKRRKLRILVITMGGPRQEAIQTMFEHCADRFEISFCPGIPSRLIRTREGFFRTAYEAGLIPLAEWEALQIGLIQYPKDPNFFARCLQNVPVTENRHGSLEHKKLHYSVEFWRKSKALNRGRCVLGCFFAHILAMKKLVEENFDAILEDNTRMSPELVASRIWDTIDASEKGGECHLRYYGWLGSLTNIDWVWNVHSIRQNVLIEDGNDDTELFHFPIPTDFDNNNKKQEHEEKGINDPSCSNDKNAFVSNESSTEHTTPGGNAIWGAYAYWISREGYNALMEKLRHDVGAIVWKGKRMRQYIVKPIDKVMPRQITAAFSREHIHVTKKPAFFRAPMLTSKIHSKWDPSFCSSTNYQLHRTSLSWSDLWLTEMERRIIDHFKSTGEWITPNQIKEDFI